MKKFLAAVLVMTLGLGACSRESGGAHRNVPEGVLRTAVKSDIKTMDVTKTTEDYMIPMNIFDRLFQVEVQPDGSSRIVNSLCTDWSVSSDGLTYDFAIRQDVVFSNGSPLTARDVQYTFLRLLTAGGVNSEIALEVDGAEEVQAGKTRDLKGFRVKDDYHFSVTLTRPNAGFLAELTSPAMSVLDEETMEKVQNFGLSVEDTIGSGPYKVTQWQVNDHYTLEYNERYWGSPPQVRKLIVSVIPDGATQNLMFQSGELDVLDLEYLDAAVIESTYKTQYADRLLSVPRVGMMYLAMNAENEFLSHVQVRKAIQMAVDVDGIIASVFHGDACPEKGLIPTGIWGHNNHLERIPYDPEGAAALLKEAGFAPGQIRFELALDHSANASTQLIYELVQQQLKKVGIETRITAYDASSWLALRNSGKMDAFIARWTMDFNDPANIAATFFGSPDRTKLRSLNYQNRAVMERVRKASAITEEEKRLQEYQDLEKQIVREDAAWVPMLSATHLFVLGDRVEKFTPYWAGYSDFCAAQVSLNR